MRANDVQAEIVGDHPVASLLAERVAARSTPGERRDGATVALVVEGGGMRGVVAGGMVTALEQLGLRTAFDVVVGTSAGALAGAYFLAGQPQMGTSIYYEDLVGREWLDYRRLLRKKPIVALDYLLDELMIHRKPLDWDLVIASHVPLYVVATRLSDYSPALLGTLNTRDELRAALRASARIPLMAGRPVAIGGEDYIDGSLAEAIPVASALTLGATHVVVLLTRPEGTSARRPRRLHRLVGFPALNLMLPGLGTAYAQRHASYRDELGQVNGASSGAHRPVLAISPSADAPLVDQLEQDPRVLFGGAASGAKAVYRALTGRDVRFFGGLEPIARR